MSDAPIEIIEDHRDLPRVDELLDSETFAPYASVYGRRATKEAIRKSLDWARSQLGAGAVARTAIVARAKEVLDYELGRGLSAVVNATGVLLHTNLGRAVLSKHVLHRVAELGARPCDLEIDLDTGKRGGRGGAIAVLLRHLCRVEDAICVNNNAAAVLLALAAIAGRSEVVVSRGELVEIGGSFRMPDIMELSGAQLVEVGTTNRTRTDDFSRAIGSGTRAVLRVHRGNFRLTGFVESPDLADVARVAHAHGVPVLVDLGHGALSPVGVPSGDGLRETIGGCIEAGADLVLSSGDKLLGGPQAGIAAGRADLVQAMREHPLHRPLRADKLTLAALDAVLRDHLAERLDEVPVLFMLRQGKEAVQARAERLVELCCDSVDEQGLEMKILPSEATVGGGSDAAFTLPSYAVTVTHPRLGCEQISARLRACRTPVVARVAEGHLLLDMRTVSDEEVEAIAIALDQLESHRGSGPRPSRHDTLPRLTES